MTSITIICAMFFEIPSGIISDKFGRKNMLILGSALDILGIFILLIVPFYFIDNFIIIITIEIFRVLGRALASGNFQVLIFQMYHLIEKDDNKFKEFSTKYFSIGSVLSASTGFLSTLLFGINPAIPLILDTMIKIIKFCSFFLIPNFLNFDSESKSHKLSFSFSLIKNKNILNIIFVLLSFSFIFVVSRATFSLYQPIMTELNIPLSYYGYLVFFINIALFLIYQNKKEKISNLSNIKAIKIVCLVLIVQIPIIFVENIKTLMFKYLCVFFFFSSMQTIRIISEGLSDYYINECLKDIPNKSFFFSIYHTIISLLFAVSFQFLGVAESIFNNFSLVYIIFCGIICIILFFLQNAKNRIENTETNQKQIQNNF